MSRPPKRKQVAARWLDDALTGPAFLRNLSDRERDQYRLWVKTWIIPPVKRLLPDLFPALHAKSAQPSGAEVERG